MSSVSHFHWPRTERMLGLVFAGYYERCRNNNRSVLSIHLPPYHHLTIRRGRKRRFFNPIFPPNPIQIRFHLALQEREKKKKNNFQILKRSARDKLQKFEKKMNRNSRKNTYISHVFSKIKHQNQEGFFRWKNSLEN